VTVTRRVICAAESKKSAPHLYEGWNAMPGQPRDCYVCGKPVRLKGESVGFRTSDPKQSWHFRCLLERRSV
jgi:hypothetical protein